MKKIWIKIGDISLLAEVYKSSTADKFFSLLPMEIEMARWGDEYYGDCGIDVDLDNNAKEVMEIGELAIWPIGQAFCIFFGPTPVSTGDVPIAASLVNPIGKILDNIEPLKSLAHQVTAQIEKAL